MVPRWTRPQCATYQPPQLVACAILLKADLALGIVVPLEHLEQVSAQSLHGSHLIELSRRETSTPTASSSSSVTLVELQQLLVSCVLRDLYPTAASAAASTAAGSAAAASAASAAAASIAATVAAVAAAAAAAASARQCVLRNEKLTDRVGPEFASWPSSLTGNPH